VFEELGRNFTLLALGTDSGDFERAARVHRIPLKIVHDIASSARDNYGEPLILVRPDQHVAWTGKTASDADATMQKVTAQ
jgi:hypothetical protein